MLMIVFVAYVDNWAERKDIVTIVNKKWGRKKGRERTEKHHLRDFKIRGELCNFAANFEMCA